MKMAEVNTLSLPLYYCFLDQNPNSGTADLLATGLHKYSTRKKKKKCQPIFQWWLWNFIGCNTKSVYLHYLFKCIQCVMMRVVWPKTAS